MKYLYLYLLIVALLLSFFVSCFIWLRDYYLHRGVFSKEEHINFSFFIIIRALMTIVTFCLTGVLFMSFRIN